jgi:hypothetical protein
MSLSLKYLLNLASNVLLPVRASRWVDPPKWKTCLKVSCPLWRATEISDAGKSNAFIGQV